ncbi:peptidase T-like protein [Malonomonas rubra DSM 5091]|uniref:Peptidase T-like protein n=1 Tax=Malonomonas rubra DSM 5091 TaxID=1122189 RepID=A0A1M6BH33_MALRU|nr:M20/M25/M40 family metallo-hydrolase [Malonomonas rubra]SHI48032.1 peptidase T-like protein [Malonomonas rubra DSM 5091]
MINRQRIIDEFFQQAAIDSPSYKEGKIASYLAERFRKLGATVEFDDVGDKIGSESGNLLARIAGTKEGDPLLLSVHMDTVTPADNVEPVLNNGIITSAGETILGADDKAGIVEAIEAIEVLRENNIPHVPLEIVVTVCEEQGLLGAKQLDFSQLKAKQGVALDTTGVDIVINRAPSCNRLKVDIFGHEAHAGVCPEQGVSAIEIAAKAIARMQLGRIDHETTANIGTIEGGLASNIVARQVTLRGEIRSHSAEKLRKQTEQIVNALEKEVDSATIVVNGETKAASMALELREDFPLMQVGDDAPILQIVREAGTALGRPQQVQAAGGGSDANIFNGNGIDMVILATGMAKVHTINEQVSVNDMVKVSELLVEIIRRA